MDACLISINPIAKCKDLLQIIIIIIIIIPVMVGVTEGKTKETQKITSSEIFTSIQAEED